MVETASDSIIRKLPPLFGLAACMATSSCTEAPRSGQARVFPTYTLEGSTAAAEQRAISNLASETQAVLRSPEFRRNLASLHKPYPMVFVRRGRPEEPLQHVLQAVTGDWPSSSYPSVRIVLIGSDEPSSDDYQHAGTGKPPWIFASVPIRLGRGVLADYENADLVTRSCAVNTLAHELSHAISTTRIIFSRAFEDTRKGDAGIVGRTDKHTPVASYLVGSVAQCTWLERKGRIAAWAVPECVQVFGSRSFNFARCGAFSDTDPIEPMIGLPSPNEAL